MNLESSDPCGAVLLYGIAIASIVAVIKGWQQYRHPTHLSTLLFGWKIPKFFGGRSTKDGSEAIERFQTNHRVIRFFAFVTLISGLGGLLFMAAMLILPRSVLAP